ncbi:MAG TPA: beta-N-acetylhexosaminidase [Gemmatimonadaceae bacterium]
MMTRSRRNLSVHAVIALSSVAAACRTTAPKPAPTPAPATPPAAVVPAYLQSLPSLSAHHIVPMPVSVVAGTGAPFALSATTGIIVPTGNLEVQRIAEQLATIMRPSTAFANVITQSDAAAPAGAIVLRLGGPASLGKEGYELSISSDSVRILAAAPAGLYRGTQTLRQLLPAGIESQISFGRRAQWTVPAGQITDRPRFEYRGAMLDVARHFFTPNEVKEFIDVLALYKMNMLHLHLADDQGWRIQIDSWPKLTTVGSVSEVGAGPGGFYSKAEYADLVRYAQDRYITIVPEIDMPGHTNAAIAAYPQLGCSAKTPGIFGGTQAAGVYTGTQVGWSVFCPDSEVVYKFVDDVVKELAAMTPGPYIHLGGDEVHVLQLPQYVKFVERVQDIVYNNGKTYMGWEEVGRARLRPTTVVQQWKSDSVPPAVSQGARAVMSPSNKAYIDMKYVPGTELGLTWAAIIELRPSYDWEPTTYMKGVREDQILGVEGALWSETVRNIGSALYMTLPRLPALAEVGWTTPSQKNWEGFRERIAAHAPRWRFLGFNYYPSPQVNWDGNGSAAKASTNPVF